MRTVLAVAEHLDTRTRILLFVLWHYDKRRYGPTMTEIGAAVGLESKSTVHRHLVYLRNAGLVTWEPTKQRTLVPKVRRVA